MTQDVVQTASTGGALGVGRPARQVPAWGAGVTAVVFLVGIGAFIYWFMGGSFAGTSDLIPDPARAERPERGPRGWRQANADGVTSMGAGRGFMVKSGPAVMEVTGGNGGQPVRYDFRYDSQALLTPEQWHMVLGVRQLSNEQWQKTLAVSKQQMDRLRRLGAVSMEMATADREKLAAAWGAYYSAAAKGEPERALVAALKAGADRALPAAKAKAQARAAEIAKLFTPDQVRELTKLGAGQKVTPIATGSGAGSAASPPTKKP